jgi:hypothetical protein
MSHVGAASPQRPTADSDAPRGLDQTSAGARHAAADALRLSALLLLAAVALPAAAEQTPEERIELLEARLQALSARVAALEATADQPAAAERGEVAWLLGEDLRGRPFRIAHKALDVDGGRLELLLQITEPVPGTERWLPGGPAPIRLTLRAPDGAERHLYMTLLRGASFEPGKHLHLLAEMDPAVAAAASQIVIEHAD